MKKIKSSRLLVIAGIIFILAGIFCLLNPLWSYVHLVRFSGIALLLSGIILTISSSYADMSFAKEKTSMRVDGILDMIFGILLIFNPLLTFFVFPFMIACWILCKGIVKIFIAVLLRNQLRGWYFILALGIIAVVFAFLIIYAPVNHSDERTKIIGAFFIFLGVVFIYDSVKLRRMHETINLLF
jgi:uncharacterized membrane protein HdeD (DUF308 family)